MKRCRTIGAVATAAIAAAVLVSQGQTVAGQTNGAPERFTAAAIDPNTARTSNIQITIDRWTSDADRDRLMMTLLDQGQDKLLSELQKAPVVGNIRRAGALSWDLRYARRAPLPDGGEQIVIATDRPVSFFEQANQPRSIEFPFTLIDIHLNKDGEGQGKMNIAARLTADRDNKLITIENWQLQPVMLRSVRRVSGGG